MRLYETFDSMDLPENLLRGIYSHGFERPSAIQQKAVVPIKDGRDVLAQAQSGTGKTGAFSIGSMCRIDPSVRKPQVLVPARVFTRLSKRPKAARQRSILLLEKRNFFCPTSVHPLFFDNYP